MYKGPMLMDNRMGVDSRSWGGWAEGVKGEIIGTTVKDKHFF